MTFLSVGVSVLGAIAVDIDHPQAFVSHWLPKEILRRSSFLLLILVIFAVLAAFLGDANFMAMLLLNHKLIGIVLISIAFAVGLTAISQLIFNTLGHRGPLHSLFFSLLMTVVAVVAINVAFDSSKWWMGLCFGWGWLSHVLTDKWFTPHDVSLWWPFR